MNPGGKAPKPGQPLFAMAAIMLAWSAIRIVWQADWGPAPPEGSPSAVTRIAGQSRADERLADRSVRALTSANARAPAIEAGTYVGVLPAAVVMLAARNGPAKIEGSRRVFEAIPFPGSRLTSAIPAPARRSVIDVQTLSTNERAANASPSDVAKSVASFPKRWTGDGWLLWREGTPRFAAGATAPLYGGSQAGAVLRYALSPASRSRPFLFARAVQALDGSGDGDLATGFGVRPLADLPITAHAEMRLSSRGRGIEVRPAAFVSGGFENLAIAPRVAVRGYGQAGYVGGTDATPFVDGSLVADTLALRLKGAHLAVGAGTWGGAQRGSSRLDTGPSVSVAFPVGIGSARLSADYRLRIAGSATPASGAAVTLSAGF